MSKPSKKLTVTCLCPKCGTAVPINKKLASQALNAGKKLLTKEQYAAAGKRGALARWGKLSI